MNPKTTNDLISVQETWWKMITNTSDVEFNFSTSTASTGDGVISFPDSFTLTGELPMEPEPEADKKGFILVNGNTWLPRPLHEARQKQQRKMARENEDYVWTK